MSSQTFIDTDALTTRAGLYSLLRSLYTYPLTNDVLDTMASLRVAPDSPLLPGLQQMQARLRGNGVPGATVEQLNVVMTNLMEGPGATPAPPYASYYLHKGQLMGPAAQLARQTYLAWQVLPDTEIRLPDDHIAWELGFLAHLANIAKTAPTPTAQESTLAASFAFIREQLLPWLPLFCSSLSTGSDESFFHGLARFTLAVVTTDVNWLELVSDEQIQQSGS